MFYGPELFGTPRHVVMDPVHGGIPLFSHEKQIIDHPLFQRLRGIRQSDVLSYVWPGATHTRFLHSLGTMHVAGQMFERIVRAHILELEVPGRDQNNEGDSANPKPVLQQHHMEAIQYFHACVRLAALLHDTGHAPFSHQFENSNEIRAILEDPRTFSALWSEIEWGQFYDNEPAKLVHEHYSVRCAYKILTDGRLDTNGIAIGDVLSIMEGTDAHPSEAFRSHTQNVCDLLASHLRNPPHNTAVALMTFFKGLIAGELDADKMDYLLRDSYFTGCMCGIYNLDHMVNNLRIGIPRTTLKPVLTIDKKGLEAFEELVYSRFQLYKQVYAHKTYAGLKLLLQYAMDEVLSVTKNREEVRHALLTIEGFETFNEGWFWTHFRDFAESNGVCACRDLLQRTHLEHIETVNKGEISDETIQVRVKDLSQAKESFVLFWKDEPKFSKIAKRYENVQVRSRDPQGVWQCKRINEETTFFKLMQDEDIVHYYKAPAWTRSPPHSRTT